MKNMEKIKEFQRDLDTLLAKYPDLPELTLTVRPRIVIDIKEKIVAQEKTPTLVNSAIPIKTSRERGSVPLNLEGSISKARLEELSKSAYIEK